MKIAFIFFAFTLMLTDVNAHSYDLNRAARKDPWDVKEGNRNGLYFDSLTAFNVGDEEVITSEDAIKRGSPPIPLWLKVTYKNDTLYEMKSGGVNEQFDSLEDLEIIVFRTSHGSPPYRIRIMKDGEYFDEIRLGHDGWGFSPERPRVIPDESSADKKTKPKRVSRNTKLKSISRLRRHY